MTPEQTAAIAAIVGLVGKWPYWLSAMVIVVIGPWVANLYSLRIVERNQERRFCDMVSRLQEQIVAAETRYRNNVKLLEVAEGIAVDYKDLAIMVNTALTTLNELVRNNLFCPLARKAIRERDISLEPGRDS